MTRRVLWYGAAILLGSPLPQAILFAQASSPSLPSDTLALSLAEAVARAGQRGDEVQIRRAQADAAEAQVAIARATGLPQLRFNGSQNRTLASARGSAVGSVFNQPYTYTANFNFSQTLFQGGKVVNASRAASAFRTAAQENVAEARAQIDLETQAAYLQALFAQRVVEIQQQSYDLAAQRLKEAEQFQEAGRVSRYDVLRARVELANIEPQLIQARGDADVAVLELKRLIKIPASQPVALTTTIDSATIASAFASVDTLAPITQRPALRAAELSARAQRLGVSVAKGDLLPTVSFQYQLGYGAFPARGQGFPTRGGQIEQFPCPDDPSRTCTQQNGGWFGDRSLGFTVSWPLFDGLRVKGAINLASAQAREAEATLSATRDQIATDFAKAKVELQRAQAQYLARRETVAEAHEAYDLAALRYSRGLSTQLEVNDAQLALTTAQTNAARAQYDLYLAIATVSRVQGRPLPLPAVR